MGFDKLLVPLAGEPVIVHTLRAFQFCPDINAIVVVTGREREEVIRRLADDLALTKLRRFVSGGAERHLSVKNGLDALPPETELVAVHDGARPLIRPEQISRCVARAREHGAAACARPVSETLKRATADGCAGEAVDRENLWVMETPQIFRRDWLVDAYQKVMELDLLVTDEVSALEHTGRPVRLVENQTPNLKITWPGDLAVAERLLA